MRTFKPLLVWQRGFTLLEVLVALAILALISSVIFKQFGLSTHQVTRLEQQTFAQMLVENKLAEIRLGLAAARDPVLEQKFAGQSWRVTVDTVDTQDIGEAAALEVSAFLLPNRETPKASLTGYVAQ